MGENTRMSIDYKTCSCCGEAFPDVMDYAMCEKCGAIFCEDCMDGLVLNEYGEVTKESCPICNGKTIDSDEFLDWLFEYAEIPFDRHSYEEEFIKYKKGKLDEN